MADTVHRYPPLKRAGRFVEKWVRFRATALIGRLTAQVRQDPPDWDAMPWKVLFLRHDRIGDMIVSTGVLRAIHAAYPGLALDVLASPVNADVLLHEPAVRAVVRFDRRSLVDWWRLWWHLRRTRYDAVIDPMVFTQSFTTLLLMLATRARWRIGKAKAHLPHTYALPTAPVTLAGDHLVDHLSQLVTPFGIAAAAATTLGVPISAGERAAALETWGAGRRILVNVSAGKAFRAWPDDRFATAARHIKAVVPEARVLVLHAPGEAVRARAIADAAGAETAAGSLRHALALVSTAEFVLTPDTSIVHAASAFHVPAVALFTLDQARRWHLYRNPGQDVITDGPTLAGIPVETALTAIDAVLAGAGLTAPPPERALG